MDNRFKLRISALAAAFVTTAVFTGAHAAGEKDPQLTTMPSAPAEPAMEITARRLALDERIQDEVMEVLARNPTLSGRIGVESEDAVVTLTGHTATPGQAWRAGRDARGVSGVRYVVNEIRPQLGIVTH